MGFSPVFVREAEVGAFASAFWRVLFALPMLVCWAMYEAQKNNTPMRLKLTLAGILAGLFFSGDLVFWHLAILNTTMANATFMVCLAPVWVVLFSRFFLGEIIGKNAVIGLLVCIMGLGLLINSSFQIDPARLLGDIYGLITSVFLGLYFVAMRFGRRSDAGGNLFLVSTIVTCIVLFVAALLSGDQMFPETAKGYASLVSLGVLTHAGGQGLVTIAIGSLTAIFSSLVIFIEAIAAALFGWMIFNEAMSPLQLLGGSLILAGVWHSKPPKNPS